MAQLTNDCFATGDRLMPIHEALGLIAERISCIVGSEPVQPFEADGRVLAIQRDRAFRIPQDPDLIHSTREAI